MKIALVGSNGRMGTAIKSVVDGLEDVEIVAEIDEENSGELEQLIQKTKPDVYVEFTNPEATLQNSIVAAKAGLPLVIGTTGLSPEQMKKLEEIVKENGVAAVISPNMSRGVNVLRRILGELNSILPEDFVVEIVDTHHKNKKDAPSGTAKLFQGILKKFNPEVHSVRAGSVPGTHQIICLGDGEQIEIIHRAESRVCFAAGTVDAARFAMKKEAGVYSMEDVLCR